MAKTQGENQTFYPLESEEGTKGDFLTPETRDAIKSISQKQIEVEIRPILDEMKKEINSSRLKVIETLGIFAALFTFISIEFQTFRIYKNPASIGGLTLILLGSLLFFVITLDYILNKEDIKLAAVIIGLSTILMIIIGIMLFVFSS